MAQYLQDNLLLWQRIGQRVLTKLASDPSNEQNVRRPNQETTFGSADLLADEVSAATCVASNSQLLV